MNWNSNPNSEANVLAGTHGHNLMSLAYGGSCKWALFNFKPVKSEMYKANAGSNNRKQLH